MRQVIYFFVCFYIILSCSPINNNVITDKPLYFIIDSSYVVSISPFTGKKDSLYTGHKYKRLVCLSSTYIAYLQQINADSLIVGVSGLQYITNKQIHNRANKGLVQDIGFEGSLDFEKIVSLKPDLFIAYTSSMAEPLWLSKLKDLGIKVFMIYDFLEQHPLSRAQYIRLLGAIVGEHKLADSVYNAIKQNYLQTRLKVTQHTANVLMNVPYNSQWFIPGELNYMSRLVEDAGGKVVGANKKSAESKVISIEEAYILSKEANFWLNVGKCKSLYELYKLNPLFKSFNIPYIYNNILQTNIYGGNNFWELGAARPDLILDDLVQIFSHSRAKDLNFYMPLQ